MAISPKDLLALTPEDEEHVTRLEALLDGKLSSSFEVGSGGQARINVAFLADSVKCRFTYKMRKELESRYTKAGWSVAFDGDFIVLAEPKPQPAAKPAPKAPGEPVARSAAPVAPPAPIDELLDQEDLPTNFPSDAEIMADVLGQDGDLPRAPKEPTGHRPPIINQANRDDPDNPYSRSRLSSR